MEELAGNKKRVRDSTEESESGVDLPEVKRIREDLLDGLEDDSEFCSTSWDLDSFMKSFEEEITASPSAAGGDAAAEVVDLTSESGESRPDLGYLLEASDDELGLPPTISTPVVVGSELRTELERVESDSSELGSEFWDIPSYDSFGLGFGGSENNDGYVALDGLFDYSDLGYGSSEFGWRSETLPAQ